MLIFKKILTFSFFSYIPKIAWKKQILGIKTYKNNEFILDIK